MQKNNTGILQSFANFDSLANYIASQEQEDKTKWPGTRGGKFDNPTKRYFCRHETKARQKMAKKSRKKNPEKEIGANERID